jgi:hypothetical protein
MYRLWIRAAQSTYQGNVACGISSVKHLVPGMRKCVGTVGAL